jgi:hypothetical protein
MINPIIDSPIVTFMRPINENPTVMYDSVMNSPVAEKVICPIVVV